MAHSYHSHRDGSPLRYREFLEKLPHGQWFNAKQLTERVGEYREYTGATARYLVQKGSLERRGERGRFEWKLAGIVLASSVAAAAVVHSAPPPGPRVISPPERQFFLGLKVPPAPPQNPVDYWIAETDAQILGAVGAAHNRAGKSCCGMGDCRYVQSSDNGDGSFSVYLGSEFPQSSSRTITVPKEKLTREEDVSKFTPKSSVLCASPTADLAKAPDTVYCFREAGILTLNDPGQWLPALSRRELAEAAEIPRPR